MLARVYSAALVGLEPVKIEVEVDGSIGVPCLIFIGLANKTIDEARERITSALLHCGVRIQSKRTVVNLAPADLKKTGSALELAIAVGLLKMYQEIEAETDDTMFFGELSLDGKLKPIKGALPLVLAARQTGFKQVFVPQANQKELEIVSGLGIFPITHLNQLLAHFRKEATILPIKHKKFQSFSNDQSQPYLSEIAGQSLAKRALTIVAAGRHNLLMVGPPGAGKSMLAKALISILPPLTESESVEITKIYSIMGLNNEGLVKTRPMRSPHHTTSQIGLIGGGSLIRPGEITLAHRGILFLDEFPEFQRSAIEALRQPIEEGIIEISRATGSAQFPARFILIAAANPCPCGFLHSGQKPCCCSLLVREKYYKKLSGPILDRIDLHLYVKAVPTKELINNSSSNRSLDQEIRQQVKIATDIQVQRFRGYKRLKTNADLDSTQTRYFCRLEPKAQTLLAQASTKLNISARGYFKIIKVAQTIADLDQSSIITDIHLAEALQFRSFSFNNQK